MASSSKEEVTVSQKAEADSAEGTAPESRDIYGQAMDDMFSVFRACSLLDAALRFRT